MMAHMAKTTRTVITDDIDGTVLDDNATPVRFALDGTQYELDLSEDNADELRQLLAPWIKAARKLPRRGRPARRN